MPRVLIIGPVCHDPDEGDLGGMGWFVPYYDSKTVGGDLNFHVFPRWSRNRRPTRDHAIEARERLLKRKGAVRLDNEEVFHAVAAMIRAAKGTDGIVLK